MKIGLRLCTSLDDYRESMKRLRIQCNHVRDCWSRQVAAIGKERHDSFIILRHERLVLPIDLYDFYS
jgi:hypothetical protein